MTFVATTSTVQVTLVDFTVTQKGLEEQLLGRVIGKEQKALEEQLSDVLEEVNSNTKVPLINIKPRIWCQRFLAKPSMLRRDRTQTRQVDRSFYDYLIAQLSGPPKHVRTYPTLDRPTGGCADTCRHF